MRIGLIARADNRGLGIQTLEAYRHLRPERTLVVDMGDLTPYVQHFERYPHARHSRWKRGELDPAAMAWLIEGSDVIFTCETPYDLSLYDRARANGVRTVCQANPEFWLYAKNPDLPRPDLMVVPTTWRLGELDGVVHLPHPVARDRLPFRQRSECMTVLHVGGHPANGDRAGTRLVMQALDAVRCPARFVVRTQHPLRHRFTPRRGQRVEVILDDYEDYWTPYGEADVLLAPRRYGGQSLPVNEALSSGMPVVALDRDPERTWGGVTTIPAHRVADLRSPAGLVEILGAEPEDIARRIERLAEDPELVADLSRQADEYATSISWEAMLPRYLDAFASLL